MLDSAVFSPLLGYVQGVTICAQAIGKKTCYRYHYLLRLASSGANRGMVTCSSTGESLLCLTCLLQYTIKD